MSAHHHRSGILPNLLEQTEKTWAENQMGLLEFLVRLHRCTTLSLKVPGSMKRRHSRLYADHLREREVEGREQRRTKKRKQRKRRARETSPHQCADGNTKAENCHDRSGVSGLPYEGLNSKAHIAPIVVGCLGRALDIDSTRPH